MSDSSIASRRAKAPASPGVPSVSSASENEAALRPKVLRRPAQFSRGPITPAPAAARQVVSVAPAEQPPLNPTPAPLHPPGRAWQDDVRFGLALIVSLFLFNLAFILLVPHMPVRENPVDESTGTAMFGNGSMPQAVGREASHVTMYSEPDAEKTTADMFSLKNMDPKQNELSVSPKDIPVPTASPLEPGNSGDSQ